MSLLRTSCRLNANTKTQHKSSTPFPPPPSVVFFSFFFFFCCFLVPLSRWSLAAKGERHRKNAKGRTAKRERWRVAMGERRRWAQEGEHCRGSAEGSVVILEWSRDKLPPATNDQVSIHSTVVEQAIHMQRYAVSHGCWPLIGISVGYVLPPKLCKDSKNYFDVYHIINPTTL